MKVDTTTFTPGTPTSSARAPAADLAPGAALPVGGTAACPRKGGGSRAPWPDSPLREEKESTGLGELNSPSSCNLKGFIGFARRSVYLAHKRRIK